MDRKKNVCGTGHFEGIFDFEEILISFRFDRMGDLSVYSVDGINSYSNNILSVTTWRSPPGKRLKALAASLAPDGDTPAASLKMKSSSSEAMLTPTT